MASEKRKLQQALYWQNNKTELSRKAKEKRIAKQLITPLVATVTKRMCTECKTEKPSDQFYKMFGGKGNLASKCVVCSRKRGLKWRLANKSKIRETAKKRRLSDPEKYKEKERIASLKWWYQNKEKSTLYRKANKKQIGKCRRKRVKERKKEDPLFNLKLLIKSRMASAFHRKKWKKDNATIKMLGCSIPEAKLHIEAQFKEGMTWENHSHSTWHIDHIVPLASAKTKEEMEKLFHYTNLRPLWAKENMSKGSKMPVK